MFETDAELLSEQISMALGRLEEIPEVIAAFANDARQSGDARVATRWSGCPVCDT